MSPRSTTMIRLTLQPAPFLSASTAQTTKPFVANVPKTTGTRTTARKDSHIMHRCEYGEPGRGTWDKAKHNQKRGAAPRPRKVDQVISLQRRPPRTQSGVDSPCGPSGGVPTS